MGIRKRLVVVGSGIAGLVAAIAASKTHEVVLVTKSVLAESNTHYAQGGIAAVTTATDSIEAHIADTLAASAGLAYEPAVRVLCGEGAQSIAELTAFGVEFDRAPAGGGWALGLEAAHSAARILHAGGDATGRDISDALVRAVRGVAAQVHEHTFLSNICRGQPPTNVATNVATNEAPVTAVTLVSAAGTTTVECDAVILASGGAGQLFRHTTNPAVATGDGIAAAFRAGATLADLEFYQFHPTALAVPGSFLISEAVRGEGAVLLNNHGERFMQKIHPAAELAPRDVVARGIQAEMLAQNGQPIMLDATALGRDFLHTRFPSITAATRAYGLDWSKTPVPVTPAAHYWMGGIATDTHGRTGIPGLFAVGEVACTGAHGANRLASNSLLESVVFSRRAVAALNQPWPANPTENRFNHQGRLSHLELADPPAAQANRGYGVTPPAQNPPLPQVVDRIELQTLMWDNVGLARSAELLRGASERFENWRTVDEGARIFTDWEDANLLTLARAMTAAALARRESRGAHYRLDYPASDPAAAKPITLSRKSSQS